MRMNTLLVPEYHVHLWWLDTRCYTADAALLSDVELDRASAFYFERDRQRFVARRTALRGLLSRYTEIDPQSIKYTVGPFGKLYLSDPINSEVQFSLSKAASLVVIAVCRRVEIGIDIEEMKPYANLAEVAQTFMTDSELDIFFRLENARKVRAFFQWWAAKESILKATGEGLQSAKQIELRLDEQDQMRHLLKDQVLSLRQIDVFQNMMTYLCTQSPQVNFEVMELKG
jgi:4'-phosphopantetheinyl transferase